MADRFAMTPQLRGVARDVTEIGSEVAAVMAALQAKIAGVAPGASCVMAEGDAEDFWSWCDQVEQVGESPQALPGSISQLGDDLERVADVFERSDGGSAYPA
jgi:hypothetical protein